MSLRQQIDNDIKKAMLERNKDELTALRSIKSLILLAETDKSAAAEMTPDTENKILMKAAKQRKEAAEIFEKEGRHELAVKERAELSVIERYLPKQMSEEEIHAELVKIVGEVGAKGPQDMGKVMGSATRSLAGKEDGKIISEIVKKLLAS
jgi:uncharacterized protein YqeY